MKTFKNLLVFIIILLGASCDRSESTINESLSGGATTVDVDNSNAFSTPAPNLSSSELEKHGVGDEAFDATFVRAPASVNGGLGPIYNNVACINCHVKDGRGLPFTNGSIASLLFRISLPGSDEHGGPNPVPGFGKQLQVRALFGGTPEGDVTVLYIESPATYPDGTPYSLRVPSYTIKNAYQSLPGNAMTSPRFARPVFGLGLLEAISEGTLLSLADEDDRDENGISGKANYVWDAVHSKISIGRFGWKANQPNLRQQVATAYNQDMGVTSSLLLSESSSGQAYTDTLSDDPELPDEILDATTFYNQTLGVPARRNINNADVKQGQKLFLEINCAKCHIPRLQTGNLAGVSAVSHQTIFPFTDLLLHDMGEGLSDGRPDFLASASEWRTPPLWGIGLGEVVNGHTNFLHDGRARNLEEAILWHGGEAQTSKIAFKNLTSAQRSALISFLNSL